MPNDAKLGLVAGLGLVLVVMMVFFRKEAATATPAGAAAAPAAVHSTGMVPARAPRAPLRPVPVKTTSEAPSAAPPSSPPAPISSPCPT